MSILIVGEKPSVSRAISAVVRVSSTHKGYTDIVVCRSFGGLEVPEWLWQRVGTEIQT